MIERAEGKIAFEVGWHTKGSIEPPQRSQLDGGTSFGVEGYAATPKHSSHSAKLGGGGTFPSNRSQEGPGDSSARVSPAMEWSDDSNHAQGTRTGHAAKQDDLGGNRGREGVGRQDGIDSSKASRW